jgi:transposase
LGTGSLVGLSVARHDLSQAQWQVLEEVLPPVKPTGRPPRNRRQVINGIRWRIRTGAPWRDVPEWYGPWETCYCVFRTWQRDGTWADVLTKLQARADAKGLITWDMSVDSTVARAHQHAAGARHDGNSSVSRRVESSTSSPTTTAWAGHAAG